MYIVITKDGFLTTKKFKDVLSIIKKYDKKLGLKKTFCCCRSLQVGKVKKPRNFQSILTFGHEIKNSKLHNFWVGAS